MKDTMEEEHHARIRTDTISCYNSFVIQWLFGRRIFIEHSNFTSGTTFDLCEESSYAKSLTENGSFDGTKYMDACSYQIHDMDKKSAIRLSQYEYADTEKNRKKSMLI